MSSFSHIENTGREETLGVKKKVRHLRHLHFATFKKTVAFVDLKLR